MAYIIEVENVLSSLLYYNCFKVVLIFIAVLRVSHIKKKRKKEEYHIRSLCLASKNSKT